MVRLQVGPDSPHPQRLPKNADPQRTRQSDHRGSARQTTPGEGRTHGHRVPRRRFPV